jgi:CubicO group peptidase (beta-lactamase class C family)
MLLLILVGLVHLHVAHAAKWCPPFGTALPAPTNVAAHPAMRSAVAELTKALDEAVTGARPNISYQANVTSSSVGALAPLDAAGVHIFQHHHAAPVRNTTAGARAVDGDSVYRIGSVTKAVTVFALLRQLQQDGKLAWDDPVTKYLPELAAAAASAENNDSGGNRGGRGGNDDADEDPVERILWDQVTLRALSCQLAGIPRDNSIDDLSTTPDSVEVAAVLGLPSLNASEVPTCGAGPSQRACQKEGKGMH